jgi:hypothetical protein
MCPARSEIPAEMLEPPSVSPARGPPTGWGEFAQAHDDSDISHALPADLPPTDVLSL